MDIKFMRTKKIIIPVMAAIILVSQLTGCAALSSNEMLEMIDQGQTIVLEVNQPSYNIVIKGEQKVDVTWVQLDQLKTFNEGFRQGVDEAFNINTILDTGSGIGGKQGCLYVVKVNGVEMRSGNTTIEDAFRNKTFVTKYWNNAETRNALMDLAEKAYTDVDENSPYATEAVLNAYFNLLNDAENPDAFNATQSVTREEFYTLLFKATEGVHDLGYTPSTDSFAAAVGGDTEYTMYAKEVADLGFLTTENKSLDGTNIKGSISRAEAVYMLVQQNFPDLYNSVSDKDAAFSDCKNAGDLALKQGFKEVVEHERVNEQTGKTEKWEETVEKDRWQTYTLAHMFKNPDKGMQSDLYKAMVVAKQVGMIDEAESRWDETLSKSEAIELVVNTQLAKNNVYGYMTEIEYAEMEAPSNYADYAQGEEGISVPGVVDTEQQIIDGIDIELADLTPTQIDLFKNVAHGFIDNVLEGTMTTSELAENQAFILDTYIMANELPANGRELFNEWKESVDYYGKLAEWLMNNGLTAEVETIKPQVSEKDSDTREEHKADTVVQQTNKPKPSEKQEQTQKQEVTSKPIKPSNNTPKEEVVGTPGDVVSAGGGNGDNFTKAEDAGNAFEDSVVRAVMATYGVSRAEAERMIANGEI